jgi:hypothetical protein
VAFPACGGKNRHIREDPRRYAALKVLQDIPAGKPVRIFEDETTRYMPHSRTSVKRYEL